MTDARFPERWLNDRRIIRLSDSEFRTFVLATAWAVANRSDGYLQADDLDIIHGANRADAVSLIAAGLWEEAVDGYQVVDFSVTQTSRDQLDGLERKKAQDRSRAKAYRARKNPESSRLSRDSSRDDIGQARPGQEGQAGQDFNGGPSLNDEWSAVAGRVLAGELASRDASRDGSRDATPDRCVGCGQPLRAGAWYVATGWHPACKADNNGRAAG